MNTQLSKKENTILFIYSDYCMYCIAMKDAWTKIKKKYKSKRIVEVEINNIYDLNENIRIFDRKTAVVTSLSRNLLFCNISLFFQNVKR